MTRFLVLVCLVVFSACGAASTETSSTETSGTERSGAETAPDPLTCAADSDCVLRTEAQCTCGVARHDAPPLPPPTEACFADPCMRSAARCVDARCVVAPRESTP